MSISSLNIRPLGGGLFRLVWTSTLPAPTFYLYVDGRLVATTSRTERTIAAPAGSAPLFEVLDAPGTPTAAFPPTALLFWYATAAAVSYRIEQYDGAAWNAKATLRDDGRGSFLWRSPPQPDGQTAQFRVVPVAANGNDGTPIVLSVLITRHPDPPAVSYAYNPATGVVTIS